jgi:hypothetical protein
MVVLAVQCFTTAYIYGIFPHGVMEMESIREYSWHGERYDFVYGTEKISQNLILNI